MSLGSKAVQGFPAGVLLQLAGVCMVLPSLPSAHHGEPYLLQRPEDDGECEGYARAQEDGLRDGREEELGLGGPEERTRRQALQGRARP